MLAFLDTYEREKSWIKKELEIIKNSILSNFIDIKNNESQFIKLLKKLISTECPPNGIFTFLEEKKLILFLFENFNLLQTEQDSAAIQVSKNILEKLGLTKIHCNLLACLEPDLFIPGNLAEIKKLTQEKAEVFCTGVRLFTKHYKIKNIDQSHFDQLLEEKNLSGLNMLLEKAYEYTGGLYLYDTGILLESRALAERVIWHPQRAEVIELLTMLQGQKIFGSHSPALLAALLFHDDFNKVKDECMKRMQVIRQHKSQQAGERREYNLYNLEMPDDPKEGELVSNFSCYVKDLSKSWERKKSTTPYMAVKKFHDVLDKKNQIGPQAPTSQKQERKQDLCL